MNQNQISAQGFGKMRFGIKNKTKKQHLEDEKYIKINKLRKMKNKPYASEEEKSFIMNQIGDQMELPLVLKNRILEYSRRKVSRNMKSEITRKSRKLEKQSSNRKKLDNYFKELELDIESRSYPKKYYRYVTNESNRIFYKLNQKYQKKFVLALCDIFYPHPSLFKFIDKHHKDVSDFISNRKKMNEYTSYFTSFFYGENIPRKFEFRSFMINSNEFLGWFEEFESPLDFPLD